MKTKAVIQNSLCFFLVISSGTILQKVMLCVIVGILHLDVSDLCFLFVYFFTVQGLFGVFVGTTLG